jgi:hypothetical protein
MVDWVDSVEFVARRASFVGPSCGDDERNAIWIFGVVVGRSVLDDEAGLSSGTSVDEPEVSEGVDIPRGRNPSETMPPKARS